jgi:hypothetical protein
MKNPKDLIKALLDHEPNLVQKAHAVVFHLRGKVELSPELLKTYSDDLLKAIEENPHDPVVRSTIKILGREADRLSLFS